MDKKVNDFIVFCIEIYKTNHNMHGKEVYDLFLKKGVIDYLTNGYDMLHTQGSEWLINDIDEYLKIRK